MTDGDGAAVMLSPVVGPALRQARDWRRRLRSARRGQSAQVRPRAPAPCSRPDRRDREDVRRRRGGTSSNPRERLASRASRRRAALQSTVIEDEFGRHGTVGGEQRFETGELQRCRRDASSRAISAPAPHDLGVVAALPTLWRVMQRPERVLCFTVIPTWAIFRGLAVEMVQCLAGPGLPCATRQCSRASGCRPPARASGPLENEGRTGHGLTPARIACTPTRSPGNPDHGSTDDAKPVDGDACDRGGGPREGAALRLSSPAW